MEFLPYLLIMALITYLIRMLPLVFFRKKINSRFIRSFLYYVPYSVLTVMTVPAVFYSTGNTVSAAVGVAVAVILAYFRKSLVTVAAGSVFTVLISEVVIRYIL